MTALAAELRAQFEAFAAAFGRPPDFVDGHQHVHLFPQVRDAALEAVAWMAPHAWVRQCGSIRRLSQRLTDPKGLLIDYAQPRIPRPRGTPRRRRQPGVRRHLYLPPGRGFRRASSRSFSTGMPEGGLVMCHPGHVDDELMRLDPLTLLREQEYAYFVGDAFPVDLAAAGVTLN